MKHIPYLDGWRGLAITGVLFGHFVTTQGINLGRLGVELFFVLSGRLMAEILFVRNKPLAEFYPRRLSRIYPALLAFVAAMLAAATVVGGEPTIPQALAAITFTTNYLNPILGRAGALDHIWSLCIEEHMYMLLGLVAYIHRRRALPLIPLFSVLIVAAVANGFVQTLGGGDYYDVYWRTDVRGASLLMGVVAYLGLPAGGGARLPWLGPILLAVGVALNFNAVPDVLKYSIGSASLAVSLVLMVNAPKAALGVFQNPVLMRVGVWSYSLYLWQQPFEKLNLSPILKLLVVPVVFVVALGSYYLIEQPARKKINEWAGRDRSAGAGQAFTAP